jgi:hypothetical protein
VAAHTTESDSLARSSLIEAAAIVTLVGPTWRILKGGSKFQDYLRHRGASIHYIFVASVVGATGLKFGKAFEADVDRAVGDPSAVSEGVEWDPEHYIAPMNALIQNLSPTGIDLKLELSDLLPFLYLLLAVAVAIAFIAHGTFRLGRRVIPLRFSRWLRPRGYPTLPGSCASATAAICYGLGFFLLLYSAQAIVLFAQNRLSSAHFWVSQGIFWAWALVAIRGFWVVFVGLPMWLRNIYGVRFLVIYIAGWVVSVVIYGIGWAIWRIF